MYQREFTVSPSSASCHGRIKLHRLLDYFQDIAGLAAARFEGTTSQLMARGYAWVLTRYELEIMAPLPALDERFVLGTFHDPDHGYSCLRAFQLNSAEGAPLAWAKTSWLLLDLAAGRPVRPLSHLPEIAQCDVQPIDPDFKEIPGFPPDAEVMETPCPVRFHDLDSNGHVNNAVYFEWAFEATPLDLMRYDVRSASASFRSGVRWGERLGVQAVGLPAVGAARPFVYHFVNYSRLSEPGKPAATFCCTWEERA